MTDRQTLARIRIVSERFVELQGLRVALGGSVFTLVFGTYLITEPPHGMVSIWIAMALSFAVLVPVERWVRSYYASTFGRQQPKGFATNAGSGWQRGMAIGAGLVVVDKLFGTQPPAGTFLVLSVMMLWVTIRDWPFRRHQLGGAAAGACAFLLQLTPEAAAEPDTAIAAGFFLMSAMWVPVGILDHQLLASAMRGRESSDTADLPAKAGSHKRE
jgi:hypothetical protein